MFSFTFSLGLKGNFITLTNDTRSTKGALRRLSQNIREDEDVSTVLEGRVQMLK